MEQLKISELIKKTFCLGLLLSTAHIAAQESVEWTTLGNDHGNTRYTASQEITPENFSDLEVVWEWDGASLGAASGRSTRVSKYQGEAP